MTMTPQRHTADRTYDPFDPETANENTEKRLPFDVARRRTAETGFDYTDFGDTGTFQRLLARHGLDLRADYVRVRKGNLKKDEPWAWFNYVWANSDVLLVTSDNPITSVYSCLHKAKTRRRHILHRNRRYPFIETPGFGRSFYLPP